MLYLAMMRPSYDTICCLYWDENAASRGRSLSKPSLLLCVRGGHCVVAWRGLSNCGTDTWYTHVMMYKSWVKPLSAVSRASGERVNSQESKRQAAADFGDHSRAHRNRHARNSHATKNTVNSGSRKSHRSEMSSSSNAEAVTNGLKDVTLNHSNAAASSSHTNPAPIEYSSSAPEPPNSQTPSEADRERETGVPSHLYKDLPKHLLIKNENGDLVPDYLKMILLSKVYTSPLNLKETPLTLAINLSARLGNEVWLKREDLHPVFSFKIRGAYNMMASLPEDERWRGVVTCSAGNHAQGVALAGFHLKIPCTIVMPVSTPSIKWRNVDRLGAKVVLHGADFDEAKAECNRLAKAYNLHFIPPFDNPYVVAGQGTVGVEIARQIKDCDTLDGVFASVGGGGLLAGMAAYLKRVAPPSVGVYGVETVDGDAMKRSLDAGERVVLNEVGPFADGTAVKMVGEETFRVCKELVDDIVLVDNDQICAAIKDVFEETRSVPEPSGALALAGLKAHIIRNNLIGAGKRYVAVISGGNMNFSRLRFVAERAELGERREVLMSVRIPEKPGSFIKLHSLIVPRATTEFSYRYSSESSAFVILSFFLLSSRSAASGPTPAARAQELAQIMKALADEGMEALDLSENEFAKSHVRHMVGGRSGVKDERVIRFEFPERPGALGNFLAGMQSDWNISMFHYRNHGSDVGKVLVGVQVPPAASAKFDQFLVDLGYPWAEETDNAAYKQFLQV